jgi:hypothetical protein
VRRLEREFARTDRGGRAVRFGLLTAALTVLGHTLAGGVPAPTVLVVALGFTVWHRLSLGRKPLTWPQLLGVAALAQVAAHVVLWVGGESHSAHTTHAAHAAHAATPAPTEVAGALPTGTMLAVHVGLALVMAVSVRRSEAALVARLWFELLLARLLPLLGSPLTVPAAAPATPSVEVRLTSRLLVHSVRRRGPPAFIRPLITSPVPARFISC